MTTMAEFQQWCRDHTGGIMTASALYRMCGGREIIFQQYLSGDLDEDLRDFLVESNLLPAIIGYQTVLTMQVATKVMMEVRDGIAELRALVTAFAEEAKEERNGDATHPPAMVP